MREEIMAVEEKLKNVESEKDTFYMEILKDYKRSNKAKDILIFVLITILLIIVAGAFYIFSTYDFSYTDISTNEGNAIYSEEGNINAKSSSR